MTKQLGELAIGSKVKLGSLYGEPITWLVIGKDHSEYPSNSVTLLSEHILTLKAFDAAEPGNPNECREACGNNDYGVSNIRQWLNSSSCAGIWYSSQHEYDKPPLQENMWDANNPYFNEQGFLFGWSDAERELLFDTCLYYDGYKGNSTTCVDKVFLLSSTEVAADAQLTRLYNGEHFGFFDSNKTRKAKPTEAAVEHNGFKSVFLNPENEWWWWLRDGRTYNSCRARIVGENGTLDNGRAYYGNVGVRPACNLNANTTVSDGTDETGAYTIAFDC